MQVESNKFNFFIAPLSILRCGLSPSARWVYTVLAARCGRSNQAWPSHSTIAEDTGYCRRTVIRALQELKEARLVTVERRWKEDGGKRSNLYWLHTPEDPAPLEKTSTNPCDIKSQPMRHDVTTHVTQSHILNNNHRKEIIEKQHQQAKAHPTPKDSPPPAAAADLDSLKTEYLEAFGKCPPPSLVKAWEKYDATYIRQQIAYCAQVAKRERIKSMAAFMQAALLNDYAADHAAGPDDLVEADNQRMRDAHQQAKVNAAPSTVALGYLEAFRRALRDGQPELLRI